MKAYKVKTPFENEMYIIAGDSQTITKVNYLLTFDTLQITTGLESKFNNIYHNAEEVRLYNAFRNIFELLFSVKTVERFNK